jgi:protein ImuB
MGDDNSGSDLATLIDRLAGRLGLAGVIRLAPRASHRPERSVTTVPALAPRIGMPWRTDIARPPRLFPRPEPVEAMAMVPDAPPLRFNWRGRPHQVARAEGPERIAAEWWRETRAPDANNWRDYYRVEDDTGARFWLYRHGPYGPDGQAKWYLHGVFA